MPKGYVIARANVTNPTAWSAYAAGASVMTEKSVASLAACSEDGLLGLNHTS